MPALEPPKGLKAWGLQLWDKVTEASSFDPAGYYLLAEACRTADIIERLSGALASGSSTWVSLAEEAQGLAGGDTLEINIVVNPLLGEIRQQRLALRQLLAQLKLGVSEANTVDDDPIAKMMAEFATPD
jgi:hypothetical protein